MAAQKGCAVLPDSAASKQQGFQRQDKQSLLLWGDWNPAQKAVREKTSRVCYSGGIGTQHSNAAVCAETDEHAAQMLCAGKENRAGTWGTQEINL